MYIPPAFAETRLDVLHGVLRDHGFATVVSTTPDGPVASHVPVVLLPESGKLGSLQFHLARQNDHWNRLAAGAKTLCIFHGPHAYISPTWYSTKITVPTWNYIVVHAEGTARAMSDAELRAHLGALTNTYEAARSPTWTIEQRPADVIEKLQRTIVGFEIEITKLEGKWKLGQNRTLQDRHGAIQGLREAGNPDSLAVADAMAAAIERSPTP
jgi:transcriptional regulator